jgi:hypothetical protein
MRVRRYGGRTNEPGYYWVVEQKFTTNPITACWASNAYGLDDPISRPAKISGGFINTIKEVQETLNSPYTDATDTTPVRTSSDEIIRGPEVEFDVAHPTVTIEQFLDARTFSLADLALYMHAVNSETMWGMDERQVRLVGADWTQQFWGNHRYGCGFPYYQRRLTFELNEEGWDREVIDEGTRAKGYWSKQSGAWVETTDWYRYQDKKGNLTTVLLDQDDPGQPLSAGAEPDTITVRHYPSRNLFNLGLPSELSEPQNIVWS